MNPLLDSNNLIQLGALIICVLTVGGFGTRWLDRRRGDDKAAAEKARVAAKETHDAEHRLLDARLHELQHDAKNDRVRIDVLERRDSEKAIDIVRMQADVESIKRGQDRIEATLEKKFDQLQQALRDARPEPEPR
jgi:hypothetical protein